MGLTKFEEHVKYSPLVMPAGCWQASLCTDHGWGIPAKDTQE
jgi:hypothetical protein